MATETGNGTDAGAQDTEDPMGPNDTGEVSSAEHPAEPKSQDGTAKQEPGKGPRSGAPPTTAPPTTESVITRLRSSPLLRHRGMRPAAVLLIGVVVILTVVPQDRPAKNAAAGLVPKAAPITEVMAKATQKQVEPPAQVLSTSAQKALKKDPVHNAAYTEVWSQSTSQQSDTVGYQVLLLSSSQLARTSVKDDISYLSDPSNLSQFGLSVKAKTSDPEIPGSTELQLAESGGKAGSGSTAIAFYVGNIAVTVLQLTSDSVFNEKTVRQAADVEYQLVKTKQGRVKTYRVAWPALALWLTVGITAALAAAAYFVPELIGSTAKRLRRRKTHHYEKHVQAMALARGRKVVKGTGASPWSKNSAKNNKNKKR